MQWSEELGWQRYPKKWESPRIEETEFLYVHHLYPYFKAWFRNWGFHRREEIYKKSKMTGNTRISFTVHAIEMHDHLCTVILFPPYRRWRDNEVCYCMVYSTDWGAGSAKRWEANKPGFTLYVFNRWRKWARAGGHRIKQIFV